MPTLMCVENVCQPMFLPPLLHLLPDPLLHLLSVLPSVRMLWELDSVTHPADNMKHCVDPVFRPARPSARRQSGEYIYHLLSLKRSIKWWRFGQCDPACDAYEDVCGPCVPPPPPSPPPAEYLPPPGQDNQPSYGRSFSPAANTNSFALPPRSQFARQFQSRSNTAPSSRPRPVRPRPSSAARTRNQRQFSPVQDPLRPAAPKSNNNWDLFFKTGIIARKG